MTITVDDALAGVASVLIAITLPLLIVVYYRRRLGVRRESMAGQIIDAELEEEYLRWNHSSRKLPRDDGKVKREDVTKKFQEVFRTHFDGTNSLRNFLLPLCLTTLTTALMGLVVYESLVPSTSVLSFFQSSILAIAIAGALLYVFPLYVARYESLSLDPHALLDLLGKLWLSVMIGVAFASVSVEAIRPVAAFLGALLPIAGLDFLKKRVFAEDSDKDRGEHQEQLAEILQGDKDLLLTLSGIGISSPFQLAYENPLKIFVESNMSLFACIHLVDEAHLCLFVPDAEVRKKLGRFGIRTALDLMTQLDDWHKGDNGKVEYGRLDPNTKLPSYVSETLKAIAEPLGYPNEKPVINMIRMMQDNPQLAYVHMLWLTVNARLDRPDGPGANLYAQLRRPRLFRAAEIDDHPNTALSKA